MIETLADAIVECRMSEHALNSDDMKGDTVKKESLDRQTSQFGLSEDDRTYFTADGPVPLTSRSAEVIRILVDQFERGVVDVSIAHVENKIGVLGNEGGTRLCDWIGCDTYICLIGKGRRKGTIRLLHPPA